MLESGGVRAGGESLCRRAVARRDDVRRVRPDRLDLGARVGLDEDDRAQRDEKAVGRRDARSSTDAGTTACASGRTAGLGGCVGVGPAARLHAASASASATVMIECSLIVPLFVSSRSI